MNLRQTEVHALTAILDLCLHPRLELCAAHIRATIAGIILRLRKQLLSISGIILRYALEKGACIKRAQRYRYQCYFCLHWER